MDGLYDAIGELARVAHANGDKIDENTLPRDESNDAHGLDIFHRGHYCRVRAVPNEPRFTIGAPFVFVSRLRDQYTPAQINERADVTFASLATEDREEVIKTLLQSDLETAEDHEKEFQTRFNEDIEPTRYEVLRLGYGSDDLWNGVVIRDRIFPHQESFDIRTYRDVVEGLRSTKAAIAEIMVETVPPLRDDYVEETIDPTQDKSDGSIAFY